MRIAAALQGYRQALVSQEMAAEIAGLNCADSPDALSG
jgi:hypothetical protein